MSILQLSLSESPSSVECEQAKIIEKRSNERQIAALQTLRSIQMSLQQAKLQAEQESAELKKQIASISVKVVESIIRSDPVHLQQLAQTFVQAACEGIEPAVPERLYIHPSCESTIQEWMQDSGVDLTLNLDPNISPGDCIVECGNQGVAANLDSYLEAAILNQTLELTSTLEQARGAQ